MARLDSELEFGEDLEELEPQRVKRNRKQKRSFRSRLKLTCCLLFLFILIFFLVIFSAALAKSGLVEIPFFSRVFYQIPKPSREVKITEDDLANFTQGLKIEARGESSHLEITDKELTFILRQLLATGSDAYFAQNLQAVITAQNVEIFGLLLKPLKANITLKIRPYLSDGQIDFEIEEVSVGDLSVPNSLLEWLTGSLLIDKLKELNQKVSNIGELETLQLFAGKIVVIGKLNLNQ